MMQVKCWSNDKTLEELGDCTPVIALCIDFALYIRDVNMHHTLGDDRQKAISVVQLPVT